MQYLVMLAELRVMHRIYRLQKGTQNTAKQYKKGSGREGFVEET